MRDLKVMLVFAQVDHGQVFQDKPHIHQAFQGLRFEAGLWVCLNPEWAYVQSLLASAGYDFPDNTQPDAWLQVGSYAHLGDGIAGRLVPQAGVAETADRNHFGRWPKTWARFCLSTFRRPQSHDMMIFWASPWSLGKSG